MADVDYHKWLLFISIDVITSTSPLLDDAIAGSYNSHQPVLS